MSEHELEAPKEPADLYAATSTEDLELMSNRPLLTGDVLDVGDDRLQVLLQHPCAMRAGTAMVDRLLVADVVAWSGDPTWKGSYKRSFLPHLNGENYVVDFPRIDVISPERAENARRVAVMSELGTTILLQRWIHHNSRVVVPVRTIHAAISGPLAEAELVQEGIDELIGGGWDRAEAAREIDLILDQADQGCPSMRKRLTDELARSAVRRELRNAVRGRPGRSAIT